MKAPILITGCPRSGKTIIAEALKISGAFFGETKKMHEHKAITVLMENYLIEMGMDPNGQQTPFHRMLLIPDEDWREKVITALRMDGYDGESPVVIKSSLIALTWPLWMTAFPDAKYLLVRRRIGDVVSSCMKTGYMTAHQDEQGWTGMAREYEECLKAIFTQGLPSMEIWPARLADGNYQQVYELLDWVGLPWKPEILTKIDPKFWKIRKHNQTNKQ